MTISHRLNVVIAVGEEAGSENVNGSRNASRRKSKCNDLKEQFVVSR
jgi:hypothetical protein